MVVHVDTCCVVHLEVSHSHRPRGQPGHDVVDKLSEITLITS